MANEPRKLEELNLIDNFLFGSVVSYPEYGEAFSRYLLKTVLGREVGKLKVIPQRVYYGSNVGLHGTVLDVYLEEQEEDAESTTVYDVEPEKNSHEDAVKAIPRRMRYYRAKIDGKGLKAGTDYGKLKKLVMIMITPFDPFGKDRMQYTVRNACVELPDMPFDDGVTMIFLNTKGKSENEPEELRQFLNYMVQSTWENAVSEDLKQLQEMVERVKHDEEVAIEYMRLWEEEERIRAKAKEEGRKEGREEGREEGRKEERANTEKEKFRADDAEKKLAEALAENERLKKENAELKK